MNKITKKSIHITTSLLLAFPLFAADSSPKDEIGAAIKKLGGKSNYSWRTTVTVPEDAPFKPGPTEGKAEKDGYTVISMSFGDNEMKAVFKGDNGAATGQNGDWQTLSEMENAEGPGRFMGMMLRNFKVPVAQTEQLLSLSKDLKKDGDTYSGDLTEGGAKTLLTFSPRRGGDRPSITNPKGSVTFWLTDGSLTRYQFIVKGTVSFNGSDFDQDRTTTVEIKDVGATKVSVPDEAMKKLNPAPAKETEKAKDAAKQALEP